MLSGQRKIEKQNKKKNGRRWEVEEKGEE